MIDFSPRREQKCFKTLGDLAGNLKKIADILKEMNYRFEVPLESVTAAVDLAEEADIIAERLLADLLADQTRTTEEKEAIRSFGREVSDMAGLVKRLVLRLKGFGMSGLPLYLFQTVKYVGEAVGEIAAASGKLEIINRDKMKEHCAVARKLRRKADVYAGKFYNIEWPGGWNMTDTMKWKDIADNLEKLAAACGETVSRLETFLLRGYA